MSTSIRGVVIQRGQTIDVLLTDGGIATIRSFSHDDLEAVRTLHDEAPDSSISNRFFALDRKAADRYIDHLDASSPDQVTALVAETDHKVMALATAERVSPDTAEVSFFVALSEKGRGVATLLLEHLAARCRREGVRRFVAEVLVGNHAMMRVLEDAGFDLVSRVDAGAVVLEMSTEATDRAVEAADRRECAAESRSLSPLVNPAVVAVAGVRREPGGVGHAIIDTIRQAGFTGELVVVHPKASQIDGVPAYPTLAAVPSRVDLLVVAVPAPLVPPLLEEAGRSGVRCAVVISSGFAEADAEGAGRQRDMVRTAREHGMRLVGPNCFGVASFDPAVRLNATFGRSAPAPGRLAVASQSGGVGIALLEAAGRTGLGLSSFVSLGNKCDVSGNDLLAAWMEDDRVGAAALYLESFGNPRKFARLARRFSERKPLLVVVGGRSIGGSRAGASHTAAVVTSMTAVEAMFTQAGVIATDSIDELVATAQLLMRSELPKGRRLGILGNAGGLGVLAADAAQAAGLHIPMFSSRLGSTLTAAVGQAAGLSNPVDLGAAASPEAFRGGLRRLLESDELDSVLVIFAASRVGDTAGIVGAVGREAARSDKPVLFVVHGEEVPPVGDDVGRNVTVFGSVESAATSLANAVAYSTWRSTPRVPSRPRVTETADNARRLAGSFLERGDGDRAYGWVDPATIRTLLAGYGVAAPIGLLVSGAPAATEAAERVGYPVAVKVADPAVLHKTDRKLVEVGLSDSAAVGDAVRRFGDVLGALDVPVLVQPLVRGPELAVGVTRDPSFGPVVMVAAGGVATEIWDDRVFLAPPVTDQDAARAVRALRIFPVLEGYRGAPACDIAGFEKLVVSVSRLAEDVPEVAEMDLNPVIVGHAAAACVDVRLRLARVDPEQEPGTPRGLRSPG